MQAFAKILPMIGLSYKKAAKILGKSDTAIRSAVLGLPFAGDDLKLAVVDLVDSRLDATIKALQEAKSECRKARKELKPKRV